MAIEIEKNVPKSAHGNAKYPWDQMEIGDSFFVPDKPTNGITAAVAHAKKRTGKKFSTAAVKDDAGRYLGTRVWRDE